MYIHLTKCFQRNEEFVKKYGCHLPWMNNMTTKTCPIIEEIHENNETVYQGISKRVMEWSSMNHGKYNCQSGTRCKRSIYNTKMEIMNENDPANPTHRAHVRIQFESPLVQNINDSYAYDSQSLVGEVGGTLGLFLGLSTYSFVEIITYLVEKLFCRHQ